MPINIEKLKQAKKERNLSYDDLAKITGYSRSTITNIFCGYIELPRHETVQAIERALGLAPEPTDEEKALGLSRTAPIALSDKDKRRLTMLMEADEVLGEERVDMALSIIELSVEAEKNKK